MLYSLLILVTVLGGPSHSYRMQYPTQYTCDEASNRINGDEIAAWYEAKHKKAKVFDVKTACEAQRVYDARDCGFDWYRRCSNALMKAAWRG